MDATGTGDEYGDGASFGRREPERRRVSEMDRVTHSMLGELRLGAVTRYVQRVNEQVEARLAGGETAAVAYPEALRQELERLRHALYGT